MSFLKGISLENFKGISNRVHIPLRPLTLLFGANSAGKSTILQALLYIREVIRTGNVDIDRLMQSGESIDLGGFKNIVHGHDTNRTMRIRFELDYSRSDLTKRVEIDEFLYTIGSDQKQSTIDLSTIGDDIETGWIEFHIGTGTSKLYPPRVLYWEVGFDGIWFARVGNWVTREDLSLGIPQDNIARAVLNEIHPLLAIPKDEEKTGNIYGGIGGPTRTEFYELYFSADHFTLPENFQKDDLLQLLSDHHEEVIVKAYDEYIVENFSDRKLFLEDTLRAALDPEGNSVIEFGILKEDGGLGLYRGISRGTKTSRYLMKINSIDRCPELLNMRGCIPDWEKKCKTGWPLSHMLKYADREEKNDLNQDQIASILFLEQMIERLCIGPLLLVKDELSSLRYIGPIRDIVPRNFKAPYSTNNERWANGFAAWDTLYRNGELDYDSGIVQPADKERMLFIDKQHGPTLIEKTSEYLNKKLGLNYSLYLEKSFILPIDHPIISELDLLALRYEERDAQYVQSKIIDQLFTLNRENNLRIIDERNGVTVEPNDIGVGVSQVLPIIVGALEKTAPILAVEQPELHVHPAVACNLGDLFIREFVKQKRLCLIETHSEHLVLRIMKRIRETLSKSLPEDIPSVGPEDVSIIFVENVDDRTVMRVMPLNERGDLVKAWPGGFFEEALRETL